eukprot:2582442-Pleurochrysis_carterae.AAC.2
MAFSAAHDRHAGSLMRHLFCSLVYSPQKPIGKPKKILYADIKEIEELDCAESSRVLRLQFVLQCANRDFTFKAPNEDACTVLNQGDEQHCRHPSRVLSSSLRQRCACPRRPGDHDGLFGPDPGGVGVPCCENTSVLMLHVREQRHAATQYKRWYACERWDFVSSAALALFCGLAFGYE